MFTRKLNLNFYNVTSVHLTQLSSHLLSLTITLPNPLTLPAHVITLTLKPSPNPALSPITAAHIGLAPTETRPSLWSRFHSGSTHLSCAPPSSLGPVFKSPVFRVYAASTQSHQHPLAVLSLLSPWGGLLPFSSNIWPDQYQGLNT